MYKIIYFLILKMTLSTKVPLDKYKFNNYFFCNKCIHFIEHKNNYPYDSVPDNIEYGKCKKFGNVNLVSGLIEYEYAKNCRSDSTKCGIVGSKYQPL